MKSTRQQIILTRAERTELEGIITTPQSRQKHVLRARIILTLGAGHNLTETATLTGRCKPTVWRWWDRFLEERVEGLLYDASRPSGKPPLPKNQVKALIELTMSPPPQHASHWTIRALAKRMGTMSRTTVQRILRRYKIKTHQVKTFKVSRDPKFVEKVRDVVGLSSNPPDQAIVLSIDAKPGIQAIGRTQTPLPMKPGQPETRTHDDKRKGTTCLLAALDIATGKVTGRMVDRPRSREFLSFRDQVAEGIKPGTPVHVVRDNVSSHKSKEVYQWLKDKDNWTFHFTPTSASWVNAVKGFFSKLARQRLKNAIFNSRDECIEAIECFIEHHNENKAQPFKWRKKPEDIVAAWKRGYQKLDPKLDTSE